MFFSLIAVVDVVLAIDIGFWLIKHIHEDFYGTYGRMYHNLKRKYVVCLPKILDIC
jgi:hypothetical protein